MSDPRPECGPLRSGIDTPFGPTGVYRSPESGPDGGTGVNRVWEGDLYTGAGELKGRGVFSPVTKDRLLLCETRVGSGFRKRIRKDPFRLNSRTRFPFTNVLTFCVSLTY